MSARPLPSVSQTPHPKNAAAKSRSPAAKSRTRYPAGPSSPDAFAAPPPKSLPPPPPLPSHPVQSRAKSLAGFFYSPHPARTTAKPSHTDPSSSNQISAPPRDAQSQL